MVERNLKGFTLKQLEEKSGVSDPLISMIENGKVKEPGFFKVVRLAKALNVSLDRLIKACEEK